jgi:hypothetical protein
LARLPLRKLDYQRGAQPEYFLKDKDWICRMFIVDQRELALQIRIDEHDNGWVKITTATSPDAKGR